MGIVGYDPYWVAPFGNPRIKAWLAAPRGLSQLPHVLLRLLKPRHPPDTLSSLGNISLRQYRRGASEISRTALFRPPNKGIVLRFLFTWTCSIVKDQARSGSFLG